MDGRIVSIKNLNDTIVNRTRDLPACSAVPQPTAPPYTPYVYIMKLGRGKTIIHAQLYYETGMGVTVLTDGTCTLSNKTLLGIKPLTVIKVVFGSVHVLFVNQITQRDAKRQIWRQHIPIVF